MTPKQRLIAVLISIGVVVGTTYGCTHNDTNELVQSTTSTTASAPSAQETAQKKENAHNTIYQIFANSAARYDKVEKDYRFSNPVTNSAVVNWSAYVDQSGKLTGPLVTFRTSQPITLSTEWIFWDELVFSSSTGKFDYKMPGVIAGQSGGDKYISLTEQGANEYATISIRDIHQGLTMLTTGSDPIIRFKGERIYDYELTEEDVTNLKNALALFDARNIDNQLDFTKIQEIANK